MDANIVEVTDDDAESTLQSYADALAAGIEASLGEWTVRCVEERMTAWAGAVAPEVREAARSAGEAARREVGERVAEVLRSDIDDQRVPPLSVLRSAVVYPTQVLADAGVPPIVRDEFDERAFPDDVYGLSPATFADIDPNLHEPGLAWGAAKAFVHLQRRRSEGRR